MGLTRNRFVIAFIFAFLFAVAVYFATSRFRNPNGGIIILSAVVLLWGICAGNARRHISDLDVLAVAASVTWGFLFSLSVAISIENGQVSVVWPRMIPALLLIPLAVTATVLPFRPRLGHRGLQNSQCNLRDEAAIMNPYAPPGEGYSTDIDTPARLS